MLQCLNCGKELSEAEIDFCRDCKYRLKIITKRGKQRKDYNIKLKWSHYALPGFKYSEKDKGYVPIQQRKNERNKHNVEK